MWATGLYEDQLLQMISSGHRYETIASELDIEHHNVEAYVRAIRRKHGAKTTPHLVAIAYQKGLLK